VRFVDGYILGWSVTNYSIPPISAGDTFQDLPRMPETADSSEPYIYIYIYIYISRFSFTYDKV
jgi:uncharacterized membrane protein YhdT